MTLFTERKTKIFYKTILMASDISAILISQLFIRIFYRILQFVTMRKGN